MDQPISWEKFELTVNHHIWEEKKGWPSQGATLSQTGRGGSFHCWGTRMDLGGGTEKGSKVGG